MPDKSLKSYIGLFANGAVLKIATIGSQFALSVLLARGLGADSFGLYAFIMSVTMLLTGIVRGGLGNLVVREVAAHMTHGAPHEAINAISVCRNVALALSVPASLMALLFARLTWSSESGAYQALLATIPSITFFSLMAVWEAGTRGFGHPIKGQIGEMIIRPLLQLSLCMLLLFVGWPTSLSLVGAAVVYTIASAVSAGAANLILRKYLRAAAATSFTMKPINWPLRTLVNFSLVAWFATFNMHINIVAIGFLSVNSEAALYQLASQFSSSITAALMVINSLQTPTMTRLAAENRDDDLKRLAKMNCNLSFSIALAVVVVLLMFGREVLTFLFGAEYTGCYPVLVVLLFGQLMSAATGSVASLLYATRNELLVTHTIIVATIVNTAICAVFVPHLGAMGAAIGAAISMALWNIALCAILYKKTGVLSLPGFTSSRH